MEGCTFCEIVSGDREAAIVWADDDTTAFLDHVPLFPGHTLLVPNAHHETIEDLPAALHATLMRAASRLAAAVRIGTGAQGTFIAMNNIVSQSVPHLHIHVVPRNRGDGLRGFFWPRHRYEDEAQRETARRAIAAALESLGP